MTQRYVIHGTFPNPKYHRACPYVARIPFCFRVLSLSYIFLLWYVRYELLFFFFVSQVANYIFFCLRCCLPRARSFLCRFLPRPPRVFSLGLSPGCSDINFFFKVDSLWSVGRLFFLFFSLLQTGLTVICRQIKQKCNGLVDFFSGIGRIFYFVLQTHLVVTLVNRETKAIQIVRVYESFFFFLPVVCYLLCKREYIPRNTQARTTWYPVCV